MRDLTLTVTGAHPEPSALAPTLVFRLRVVADGRPVHAGVLRCQVRVEPQRRSYEPDEEERLLDVFGEPGRWGTTLRPFLLAHAQTVLPRFTGVAEVDLPVICSYDLEVAGGKYLHALDGGEVPLVLLFSGTVFTVDGEGLSVEPVSWGAEAGYRLPVAVWRELIDRHFPNSGWLRLSRETLDALGRFKAARALATWDQTVAALLEGTVPA
jgi:hypothetical protein